MPMVNCCDHPEWYAFQKFFDKKFGWQCLYGRPGWGRWPGPREPCGLVPLECKRRTSGPDCLSAASFWAARRAF